MVPAVHVVAGIEWHVEGQEVSEPIERVPADPDGPAARRGFSGPSMSVTSEDFAKVTGRPAMCVRESFEAHRGELLAGAE